MATFDQALTESALIVIPVLIFLLAVGWFKYSGDSGVPKAATRPPQPSNQNGPGGSSNPNVQNRSNNTNTPSPPNNATNTPSPPNNATNTTSPPNNTTNTVNPPATTTTSTPGNPAGNTAGSDNDAVPGTAAAGGVGVGGDESGQHFLDFGGGRLAAVKHDPKQPMQHTIIYDTQANQNPVNPGVNFAGHTPPPTARSNDLLGIPVSAVPNGNNGELNAQNLAQLNSQYPEPRHGHFGDRTLSQDRVTNGRRGRSRSRNGGRRSFSQGGSQDRGRRRSRSRGQRKRNGSMEVQVGGTIEFAPDKKKKKGRSRSNGKSPKSGRSPSPYPGKKKSKKEKNRSPQNSQKPKTRFNDSDTDDDSDRPRARSRRGSRTSRGRSRDRSDWESSAGPDGSQKRDMLKRKDATAQDHIRERLEKEAREQDTRGRSTSRGSKRRSRVASPRPDRRKEEEKDRKEMEKHRKRKGKPLWNDHQGVGEWLDQDDSDQYTDRKAGDEVKAQEDGTRKELDVLDKELDDIISKRKEKKEGGGEVKKDGEEGEDEQLNKVRDTLKNLKEGSNKEQFNEIQRKLAELDPDGQKKADEEQKKKDDDERQKRVDNGETILSDDDSEEDEFFMKGPKMPKSPGARSRRSKKQRGRPQASRRGDRSDIDAEDDYIEYSSDNPISSPGARQSRGASSPARSRRRGGSIAQSHATTRTGRTSRPHASPTGRSRASKGRRAPSGRLLPEIGYGESAFSEESGEEGHEPVSNRSEYSRPSRTTKGEGSIDLREAAAALTAWEAEARAIAVGIENGPDPFLPVDKQDEWYADQVVLFKNLKETRPWMKERKRIYWEGWLQDTRDALQTAKENIDRSRPNPKEETKDNQGPEPITSPSSKTAASQSRRQSSKSSKPPGINGQTASYRPEESSIVNTGPERSTDPNAKNDVRDKLDRGPPPPGSDQDAQLDPRRVQPSAAHHQATNKQTRADTPTKVSHTAQWEKDVIELYKSIMEERKFSNKAEFDRWSSEKKAEINASRQRGVELISQTMEYSSRKEVNDMLNAAEKHVRSMKPTFDPEFRGNTEEAAGTPGKEGDNRRDPNSRAPKTQTVHAEVAVRESASDRASPERKSWQVLDLHSWKAEARALIEDIESSLPLRSSENEDDIRWAKSKDAELRQMVRTGRHTASIDTDTRDTLNLLLNAENNLDIWRSQDKQGDEEPGSRAQGNVVVSPVIAAGMGSSGPKGRNHGQEGKGNEDLAHQTGKVPNDGPKRGTQPSDGTLPIPTTPFAPGRGNGRNPQVLRAEIPDPSHDNWRSIWEEQWQKHWSERTQACNLGDPSEEVMAKVDSNRKALLDPLLEGGKSEAISRAAEEYRLLTEFFKGLNLENESLTSKGLDQEALWVPSFEKWREVLQRNKLDPAELKEPETDLPLKDPLTGINDLSPESGTRERSKKTERQPSVVRRAKPTTSTDSQDQRPDDRRGQEGSSRLEPDQDHSYPPKKEFPARSSEISTSSRDLSPSWYDPRPVIKGTFSYIMQAKLLCVIWIVQFAISIFGIRQLSALVTMPRNTNVNSNSLEKRATDDVPVDIQFTQKWLGKILGDSNSPDFAFILLVVWISLCILTSGIIYNMIIEKVENPSTETEKDGKWSQAIKMYSIRIWKGIKSFIVVSARVLLMDRHPSWSSFTAGFGWRTLFRIGVFIVQLLVILSVTRHVITTASLIADPENPYPSGLELQLTLPMIKDAMPTMSESPNMTMLLIVIVLSGIIIIGLAGWHALLHPHSTAPQTSKMLGRVIHGSGLGYQAMVAVIAIILVLSFSACLVFFVQIMQSVTELDFIKNGGYGDNVGLVGGLLIFGIFVPPVAWVCMEVWDILCIRFRGRGTPAAQRSNS